MTQAMVMMGEIAEYARPTRKMPETMPTCEGGAGREQAVRVAEKRTGRGRPVCHLIKFRGQILA